METSVQTFNSVDTKKSNERQFDVWNRIYESRMEKTLGILEIVQEYQKGHMANNRMILVCNVCNPVRGTHENTQGILHLAKWYPTGGIGGDLGNYYRNDNGKELAPKFLDFLEKHTHPEYASEHYTKGAGQSNPVRIEYESEDLPVLRENPPSQEKEDK